MPTYAHICPSPSHYIFLGCFAWDMWHVHRLDSACANVFAGMLGVWMGFLLPLHFSLPASPDVGRRRRNGLSSWSYQGRWDSIVFHIVWKGENILELRWICNLPIGNCLAMRQPIPAFADFASTFLISFPKYWAHRNWKVDEPLPY